ncbi:MAG TPA: 2-hydroxyglutaryl-CoA dehydratase [Firmicutes bacterium]|nr:2-hydroxyglutaryl-CoA dehydratase [Bacillota bacterium]
MLVAGIDSGSTATKVVLLADGRVCAAYTAATGADPQRAAARCLEAALARAGAPAADVSAVVATGYGRERVSQADRTLTEITCHARGAHALVPEARTVIDIGGQDSKVIRLDDAGLLLDFVMNDKCAAGTGRFLEVMANRLEIDLTSFGGEWLRAKEAAKVSSTCTVFAESEVIGLVAAGTPRPVIIRGLCEAVAARIAGMARRAGVVPAVVFTGGVSLNAGVRKSLEQLIGQKIVVPPLSQFMGAYGAALFARDLAQERAEAAGVSH